VAVWHAVLCYISTAWQASFTLVVRTAAKNAMLPTLDSATCCRCARVLSLGTVDLSSISGQAQVGCRCNMFAARSRGATGCDMRVVSGYTACALLAAPAALLHDWRALAEP
jgi:hypothetical protein